MRGAASNAAWVSPPRKPQPKMSFLRSQRASASCVGRSNTPGTNLLRGESSPSQTSRACTARTALTRICPCTARSTRARALGSARNVAMAVSGAGVRPGDRAAACFSIQAPS